MAKTKSNLFPSLRSAIYDEMKRHGVFCHCGKKFKVGGVRPFICSDECREVNHD